MTGNLQPDDRLGDFTADRRVLTLTGMAALIGVISAFVALALLRLVGFFTHLFYYHAIRQSPRLAGRQPPGCLGAAGPHRRGPHRRAHGAVWLRADPWPRHPGGARGDSDRAEPDLRPGRRAQAAVLRHFHRDRWAVRR